MEPKVEVMRMFVGKKGSVLAFFTARISFEEYSITLPNLKIVEGNNGRFIGVPSRKYKEQGFVNLFFPNKPLLGAILKPALENYKKALKEKKPYVKKAVAAKKGN
jgi:DNA-binding cell septation regulator SpoVG